MSRIALLTILMFCAIVSSGQNISVTFTGTGTATRIDSVTATNQRTRQSVALPGSETLVLTVNTGIPTVSELTDQGIVFPNPFSGRTTFTTAVQKPQTVYLNVRNLAGELVAETQAFVQPGESGFDLSFGTAGIYVVTLTTEEAKSSYKIICSGTATVENSIQILGTVSNNHNTQNNQNPPTRSAIKSLASGYTLGYAPGDMIQYRCRSSIYTSIFTDSPASSKSYTIVFAACTDPDGRNYSIVKIGNQTWMAENLAYLPAISPSSIGSYTDKHYYVYGYEGTVITEARNSDNYITFGVLYNWPAAMNDASGSTAVPSGVQGVCPAGWHLPSDAEWTILTDYLGSGAGKKMKAPSGWNYNGNGDNSSYFTALPGGDRFGGGAFYNLGYYASFWSSSDGGSTGAWYRYLYCTNDRVYRHNYLRSNGYSVRCLQN